MSVIVEFFRTLFHFYLCGSVTCETQLNNADWVHEHGYITVLF